MTTKKPFTHDWLFHFILIVIVQSLMSHSVQSQESSQSYEIGHGDVLSISFWQQPDLNTTVRVNQKGEIVLPVIGSIVAVGLNPSELGDRIVDEISIYNKDITQASVNVVSYGSNKIYVSGHVLSPGKYTFEVIPNLWEAILEAGGPAETAMLSHVNIIRGEKGRKKNASNVVVNLSKKLEQGDLSDLPALYPGDTIYIPGVTGEIGGVSSGVPQLSKDYVFVYGQVNDPGVFTLEDRMDILRTLVMAGGPTPAANLEDIRIISQQGVYPTIVNMNLKKFTSKAELKSIVINPGDTIYVPQQSGSFLAGATGRIIIREFLRVIVATGMSVLLYSTVR